MQIPPPLLCVDDGDAVDDTDVGVADDVEVDADDVDVEVVADDVALGVACPAVSDATADAADCAAWRGV